MLLKIFIFIVIPAIVLLVLILALLKASGKPTPGTCKKNQLEGCRGICCAYCDLSDSCSIKCKADPDNCGESLI